MIAGREPSDLEWQPEKYPFENGVEFVEVDEGEAAPRAAEPERKTEEAAQTVEIQVEPEA